MTTPRDAAVERFRCSMCDAWVPENNRREHEESCDDITRRSNAALASPPAPETTLAELVDAYRKTVIVAAMASDHCHPSRQDTPEFQRFKDALDAEHAARADLVAYQPPAPVSRAGAVEAVARAIHAVDPRGCSIAGPDELTYSLALAALAASPPAFAVRAVTDEMVSVALNEWGGGPTKTKPLPIRMRAALEAALAAAEGSA